MTLLLIIALVVAVIFIIHSRSNPPNNSNSQYPQNDYRNLYGNGTQQSTPPPENYELPRQIPNPYASDQHMPNPYAHNPNPYTPNPQQASSPVPPPPPVPKKPFSPIPLLLIAGVVFLFLGGIIFLTGTWSMLPDIARAIALLSASAVAFTINVLAERVLKLPKTGLAFYILGCIFLPLALGGIGAFSLFGEWFSFHGDGSTLLMALISLCIAATSFLGQSNYKSPVLAWLGLTGLGGVWTFLSAFFCGKVLTLSAASRLTIFGALLVLFAVFCTCAAEHYLRSNAAGSTPLSNAWVPFLYVQHSIYLLIIAAIGSDAALSACILSLFMAALFLNERFLLKSMHCGVFGFTIGIMISLGNLSSFGNLWTAPAGETFLFVTAGTVFVLLTVAVIPKLQQLTLDTMRFAGWLLCSVAVPTACFMMLGDLDGIGTYFLFLFIPLIFSAVYFFNTPRNPVTKDTPSFVLFTILLFATAMSITGNDSVLLKLMLIGVALLLLLQAFLSHRIWPLALSICTCIAIPLSGLAHAEVLLTWLSTAALLAGLIYAHMTHRPLLERSCAWASLPFLLTACCATCKMFLGTTESWILTIAVLALVYLAESTLFRNHLRSVSMRTLCMDLSVFLCLFAVIAFSSELLSIGWMLLFVLSLAVLAAANLRRNINIAALPMMIYLFAAIDSTLQTIESIPGLTKNWTLGLFLVGYLAILVLFALMGRLLLPGGFYNNQDKKLQIDWALIIAAFPIISAAEAIDWYPSILCCLMLSVYSLLYIGRVKTRYIPTLLASAFGCLTLFFHNVNDPFRILEIWHNADFKSPQILLYLLPMHLFILSMLWILPERFRSSVHVGRFCMYCFTMLCMLIASLSFGRAEDGIILAVFSFLILAGSFFVKRLRWFTLGFSVLSLITIRMTWRFWQSLHWGIYLFLAGAVLLGIAFYYELAIRRADEKKNEPKEKINLFKEWNW